MHPAFKWWIIGLMVFGWFHPEWLLWEILLVQCVICGFLYQICLSLGTRKLAETKSEVSNDQTEL